MIYSKTIGLDSYINKFVLSIQQSIEYLEYIRNCNGCFEEQI